MKRFLAVSLLLILLVNIPGSVAFSAAAEMKKQYHTGIYTYELDHEIGGAIIVQVAPSAEGNLVVPDTLNGFPVIGIGDQAFFGCNRLTGVTLPNSVYSLGERVFLLCETLERVSLPDSLISISGNPFPGCSSLHEISIAGNPYYEMQNQCLIDLENDSLLYVLNAPSLVHYTVPQDIRFISSWAFAYCDQLLSISLPDTIEGMGKGAFFACSSLSQINSPAALNSIGAWAFFGCTSLVAMVVPDGVSVMNDGVFQSCTNLKSIMLPDTIQAISETAFSDCDRLSTVYTSLNNSPAIDFARSISASIAQPEKAAIQVIYRSLDNPTQILLQQNQLYSSSSTLSIAPDASVLPKGYVLANSDAVTVTIDKNSVPSIIAVNFYCTTGTIYSASAKGFAGPVYVEFTLDEENRISSLTIGDDSFNETPFMGARALEESFIRQFIGKSLPVTLADIDALTGATYTTNAVLSAIYQACPVPLAEPTLLDPVYQNANYKYQCYDNQSVVIIGPAGESLSGSVKIPSFIDGMPVVEIAASAFSRQSNITSLIIPDSVQKIGKEAFEYCTNLSSLTLPDTDLHIEAAAFKYCNNLSSVTIPDRLLHLDSNPFNGCNSLKKISISKNHPVFEIVDGALYDKQKKALICYPGGLATETLEIQRGTKTIVESAVFDCTKLKKIVIPDGVTHIGAYAFWSCENVSEISVPDSIAQIDITAFACMESISSFAIPESLVTISPRNPFWNNQGMKTFSVSTNHPVFSVRNYALYEKKTNRLVCYPCGRTDSFYDIIPGTKIIGEFSFYACKNLTAVNIPDGVTTLETSAFWFCSELQKIAIPDSVTTFGDNVFRDCDQLTIYCPPNSAAHKYAKENGIPFVVTEDYALSAPTSTPAAPAYDPSTEDDSFGSSSQGSSQNSSGGSLFNRITTPPPAPTPTLTPAPTKAPTAVPTKAPAFTVPPAMNSSYSQGDSSGAIYDIKLKLQEYGYFSSDATFSNSYNASMAERVKEFQKNNGLDDTGDLDELTLRVLYSNRVVATDAYRNKPATLDLGSSASWEIDDGELALRTMVVKSRDARKIVSFEISIYMVDTNGNYYPAKNKAYTCQIFQQIDTTDEIIADYAYVSCPVDRLHRIYLGIKSVTFDNGMTIIYDTPHYYPLNVD